MKQIVLLILCCISFINISGQQVNRDRLSELIAICKKGHSDGMIIYQDGELITESYFGKEPKRIDIKSVTKSITNLAVGYLVTQGKLNIDQKVHEFYPEWKQENKMEISIKHLLTHTSGTLDSDFALVESAPDIVKLALSSDQTHPVGKYYVYNNKAVNLLVGIIEKSGGKKLDELVKKEIFMPLGITDFIWPKDHAGNPYAMAFLQMYPKDLARIGRFVLNKGKWEGKQIIDPKWFDISMEPGAGFMPEYGLLWELLTKNFRLVVDEEQIQKMIDAGVEKEFIEKAKTIKGVYRGYGEYYGKIREVFGKDFSKEFLHKIVPFGLTVGKKETDGIEGYAGIGYLGQYLVIYPKYKVVAVRGINHYAGYNWETDEISDFPQMVLKLIED
ncbi:serine hydrolase domain-containing protein [Spongiimicrobium sp. 2-473A-2-J]|uniref:serine hydrolase domain-containing protein n=1 Tax=Eudoraea algarum TaxID=3417568 RepID=UPI003D362C06